MTREEVYEKLESAIDTLIELNNGVTHEDIQQVIADLREIEIYLDDDSEDLKVEHEHNDSYK